MNYLLLLPILLPVLAGTGLLIWAPESRRARQVYVMAAVLLTTALALYVMFLSWSWGTGALACTLLRFHGNLFLTLRIDSASMVFGCIVALLWPVTAVYAFEYMKHEGAENRFFGFFTISYGIVLGVAFSSNFLTLYLFYELMTFSTLPMVMHTMDKKARYAGREYLIYSLSGAAFAFIGIVFLLGYGTTLEFTYGGVLDMAKVAGNERTLRVVFVGAFFGFGVKAAIFPFHSWLPDASVAPTPVSALLHAVAVVKAGVFAVLRLTYYGFGTDFLRGTFAQDVVMAAAVITIVYGSAKALRTSHLKRRLAYSTVSNLSYILFSITLMTPAGLTGALTHMVFHAVVKISLFFCAGAVIYKTGKEYVYDLEGYGGAMPVVMGAFTFFSVALMGVPPLGGFASKWTIASAAVATGRPLAYAGVAALVFSTLLTTLYMMTVVVRAYFPVRGVRLPQGTEAADPNAMMKAPLLALAAACLVLSLGSHTLISVLRQVAGGLV